MKNRPADRSRRSVRRCAVCGTFYPAGQTELTATIDRLIADIPPSGPERIRGIIAPHAGYIYSGPTAASAYGRLRGSAYDAVVIVSPSHREYFDGVSVFDGDAYQTPLGVVDVNGELRRRLLEECQDVVASSAGHGTEHAVEVHLPFLQRVLGEFSFLPLVIGHQTPETCFTLGEAIARMAAEKNLLLVASTDLSHFYPAETALRLDAIVIEDVRAFDARGLMLHLEEGKAEACGGGPVVAVMTALRRLGSSRMDVLQYATSGDVTGDYGSVVGYLGAVAL
ncbi:MAG: AmmeMemoRadiSam system protein B [Bacteroidota bacterium]